MTTHRPTAPRAGRRSVLALALGLAALAAQAQPSAGTAYVTNQNGPIAVIDLATLKVARSIDPHGKESRGIGITPDGRLLVVANRSDGSISVIEAASGRLVRKVKVGENPEFVRVRGRLAFVSYEPASTGKPPPQQGATQGATPGAAQGATQGAGREHDDDKHGEPARVAIVDIGKGKVVRSIKGGLETEGIEFSTDGKHLLVTNEEDDTVTVHAISNGKLVATIDTKQHGKRPRGIKRSPDGRHYVATLEFGNSFIVIGADYQVVKTVKTAESPYGVAFDRAGKRLFVASAKSQMLQVFDTATWDPVKDVPVGKRCWHFSFTPDDKRILLACGRSDEVVVVDAQTLEATQRIGDMRLPWGVVTYPKSVGSLDQPD